jgi:hypothetical protein
VLLPRSGYQRIVNERQAKEKTDFSAAFPRSSADTTGDAVRLKRDIADRGRPNLTDRHGGVMPQGTLTTEPYAMQ